MYVRCVHIRTNANLVSVRTRLTVVSLSEPHILAIRLTSGCLYLSMYLCVRRCPPKPPHMNFTPTLAHSSLYSKKVFAVGVKDSSYNRSTCKLTVAMLVAFAVVYTRAAIL